MIVDTQRKFAFVHIPKTGGSAIKQTIASYLQEGACFPVGLDKHRKVGFTVHKHGVNPEWTIAAVARNPWDLIASDYEFSLEQFKRCETHERNGLVIWAAKLRRVQAYPRFADFVEQEYLSVQPFWELYCFHEGVQVVNWVLRFENLEHDYKALCESLRLPKHKLKKVNVTPNRKPYRRMYSEDLRRLVGKHFEKYRRDFGYQF